MLKNRGLMWTAVVDRKSKKIVSHIVIEGTRQERFDTHEEAKQRFEWLLEVRDAGSVQAALKNRPSAKKLADGERRAWR